MKFRAREFIGRGTRGRNAWASVSALAERSEDGSWIELADPRGLFPPDGCAEVRGVSANAMRDGDWYVYQSAPNDRHRARMKFKAVGPRRLIPFFDIAEGDTPESRRRVVVEVGLENGEEGEAAVRISAYEVVKVYLERGIGDRRRARGAELARLAVRRFAPERAIRPPNVAEEPHLYDYDGSEQTGRLANWLPDAEYVVAAIKAVGAAKPEISSALVAVIEEWSKDLNDRLSASGGIDPSVLEEIARSGALSEQLRAEGAALEAFKSMLLADPSSHAAIESAAKALADQQKPAMVEAVRADVRTQIEKFRAEEIQKTRSVVEEIEADGLAAIARQRDRELAKVETELAAARTAGIAEVAEATRAARAQAEAEEARLYQTIQQQRAAAGSLEARVSELAHSAEQLSEQERNLLDSIEKLSRAEQGLAARSAVPAFAVPSFTAAPDESTLRLHEVRQSAQSLGLLSERGVDAVVRLAIYAAAGEVPVITGGGAAELVEVAALVLSNGRIAGLFADPTTVTFEDLWNRPGGNGPTILAAAARACNDEPHIAVLGCVYGAERSGARFWFPPLADACRREALPRSLLLCVTVGDADADEAQAIAKGALVIEAENLFADGAATVAPIVFGAGGRQGKNFTKPVPALDAASALAIMQKLGRGLPPSVARRVAAISAAALAAGEEEGDAAAADAAKALRAGSADDGLHGRPYIVSSTGNA